jgi:uncharacterized protein (TIGR02186 family)
MKGWALAILVLFATGAAKAQTLTADLSSHVIGITTGFVGANLVFFGSTDRPGDIAIIVRGPPTDMTVRRKEKILGVWINGSSAVFHDAPSFYAVAATKPLKDVATPESLVRHAIGLDNVKLLPTEPIPQPRLGEFRAALIDAQEKIDLYRGSVAPVTFLGEHLFRADMFFPANVPTGSYSVEVVLLSGGEVADRQPDRFFQRRLRRRPSPRGAVRCRGSDLRRRRRLGRRRGLQEGVSMVETVPLRVFLVVVDESPEMPVALYYASRRAERTGGRVALLRVIPREESHGLASVEALMREEAQQEAEQLLQRLAKSVVDEIGALPILYIKEGSSRDELMELVTHDPSISILVLAAGTGPEGPGPLISFLATKGMSKLRIPVTIVPGNLTHEQIDAIS